MGCLGVPWSPFGPQLAPSGCLWPPLDPKFALLEHLLGVFRYLLGSLRVLGVSWGLSGAFLSDFSVIWGRFLIFYRIVSYSMLEYRVISYRIVSYGIVSYHIVSYRIV